MASAAAAILVICEEHDLGARRVHQRLGQRHAGPVLLVTTDALCLAPFWRHEPGIGTEIVLGNGLGLTDAAIGAVFNRIVHVDPPQFRLASPDDHDYAQAEMHALVLSWLETLGERVVNRPAAASLGGARLTPVEDRLALYRSAIATAEMAVATSARRVPAKAMTARPFHPHGRLSAAMPVAALAGGPVLLEPAGGEELRAVFINGWTRPGHLPAALGEHAAQIMRGRGILIGEVSAWQSNDGGVRMRAIDCLPALDDDEDMDAASRLLMGVAAKAGRQ